MQRPTVKGTFTRFTSFILNPHPPTSLDFTYYTIAFVGTYFASVAVSAIHVSSAEASLYHSVGARSCNATVPRPWWPVAAFELACGPAMHVLNRWWWWISGCMVYANRAQQIVCVGSVIQEITYPIIRTTNISWVECRRAYVCSKLKSKCTQFYLPKYECIRMYTP